MFNTTQRPLRELFTALGAFVVIFAALLIAVVFLNEAAIDIDDMRRPDVLIYAMLTIIVMIPACWVAVRWAGKRTFASLFSAENRFRWEVALRPLPLILVVFLAGNAAFLAFNPHGTASFDATSLLLLGIVVLTVPLQAAAEELVFRGLLPQIVGGWVKSPWLVYGIPSVIFVAGHTYDWKGLIDIAVYAVCMSVLVHRTRGIEIPIVLHVLNNLCAFGLGAIGVQDLNQEVYSWAAVIASSATTIVVTALILADEKLMDMCAPEDSDNTENAPHQSSEERNRQKQAAASARPEMRQRGGQRPNPEQELLVREQQPEKLAQRPEQLARSPR